MRDCPETLTALSCYSSSMLICLVKLSMKLMRLLQISNELLLHHPSVVSEEQGPVLQILRRGALACQFVKIRAIQLRHSCLVKKRPARGPVSVCLASSACALVHRSALTAGGFLVVAEKGGQALASRRGTSLLWVAFILGPQTRVDLSSWYCMLKLDPTVRAFSMPELGCSAATKAKRFLLTVHARGQFYYWTYQRRPNGCETVEIWPPIRSSWGVLESRRYSGFKHRGGWPIQIRGCTPARSACTSIVRCEL